MSEHDLGQVAGSAAEVYERVFVPALFADWPPRVLAAVGARPGERILDVACGTGVLARAAESAVGKGGSVVGVDVNEGMLAVARRLSDRVEWRTGEAEALPFDDGSFDRVVSQFGLMFFADRTRALREMRRVLRPGGRMAVAVWASLDATPGYAAVAEMLEEVLGADVARSIEAPYALGDVAALRAAFVDAGLEGARIETVPGTARFASLDAWLHTDIRGWTLADVVDDAQFERLRREAPRFLGRFVGPEGRVEFDAPAHFAVVDA